MNKLTKILIGFVAGYAVGKLIEEFKNLKPLDINNRRIKPDTFLEVLNKTELPKVNVDSIVSYKSATDAMKRDIDDIKEAVESLNGRIDNQEREIHVLNSKLNKISR